MKTGDVREVVSIHRRSFQGFFLSFLGENFLALFYNGVILSPQGLAWVYEGDKRIEGFICGAIDPSGFFRSLLKKKWRHFAFASLGAVVKRPSIIPRLLRAVRHPSSSPGGMDKVELMSIGVDPETQSKGIGKSLVHHFLDTCRTAGVREVNLTTDRWENEKVNRFYQNLGFILKRSYTTPEKREMNEYVYKL